MGPESLASPAAAWLMAVGIEFVAGKADAKQIRAVKMPATDRDPMSNIVSNSVSTSVANVKLHRERGKPSQCFGAIVTPGDSEYT